MNGKPAIKEEIDKQAESIELDDVARKRIEKWLEKPQEFGELRYFKIRNLRTDTTYQRAVSIKRVKHMALHFDPRILGTITVGLRGGNENVIDGQHRLALAFTVGEKRIPELAGIGLPTQNVREEAYLFVQLNENRRRLMQQHTFAAKLLYGEQMAVEINELVKKYKFKFKKPDSFYMKPNQDEIVAINSLENIYRAGGSTRLAKVLQTLRRAWDGDPVSVSATMIRGMGRLYEAHPDLSPITLAQALKEIEPFTVRERAYRTAHTRDVSQLEALREVIERIAEL